MVCCSIQPQLTSLKRGFRCHDVPECSRRTDVLCLLLDFIRRRIQRMAQIPEAITRRGPKSGIDFVPRFLIHIPFSNDAQNVLHERPLRPTITHTASGRILARLL